ncbi:Transmembrane protein 62 [Astathelohania contejeani]|uniref:Transmembrane protein 62 n=1 Tax=Astathelohania contejeani TaxID=164912 RepID=A0ABQ7I080_9MICR|nr:Transmembrane protein 62 [Thelohania contejeani]
MEEIKTYINRLLIFITFIFFTDYFIRIISFSDFIVHKEKPNIKQPSSIAIERSSKDYFYFIQVTDIHINTKVNNGAREAFGEFIALANKLNPEFIAITGDIVDSRQNFTAGAIEEDYQEYAKICKLSKCQIYDVVGNHDRFGLERDEDYFHLKYFQNKEKSYFKIIKGNLFVFIDGTLSFSPRGFLNFFGNFNDKEFANKIKNELAKEYKHVFIFCHYPSNVITSEYPEVFQGSVYLCGHFHDLLFFPQMYYLHPNGCLEAELCDFKKNRMYRIVTVDNGIVNFNDIKLNNKPIIAILTPKDAKFKSTLEPEIETKYLRFLVFNSCNIKVYFDGKEIEIQKENNNLYSASLPRLKGKIKIIANNHHGQSAYEISTHDTNTCYNIILNINFRYFTSLLFIFFILIYIYTLNALITPKIKILSYFISFIYYGRFTNKNWYYITSTFAYPSWCISYDIIFAFTFFLLIVEGTYLMYKNSVISIWWYLAVGCLNAYFFHFNIGLAFSLFEFWLCFEIILLILKKYLIYNKKRN